MPLHSRLITFIFSSFLILGSAFGQMAAIEAEVTGVDGRSAKAAEVRIERQDKKMAQLVGKTDRRGRLTTTNLEVGTYKLTATVEGGIQLSQVVKTRPNVPLLVAIDMRKSAAVTSKPKKRFIWVQAETGTRIGGHWVEADDANQAVTPNGQNVDTLNGNALNHAQYRSGAPGGGQ